MVDHQEGVVVVTEEEEGADMAVTEVDIEVIVEEEADMEVIGVDMGVIEVDLEVIGAEDVWVVVVVEGTESEPHLGALHPKMPSL